MVARISTGKDIYGALAYNQQKVDRGEGAVLRTSGLLEPANGYFTVAEVAGQILHWMPSRVRTEKPVIHISLNPDPRDMLSDEDLADIADKYMDGMGWGTQPYIVYKHTDIDRTHIHIVSVQVDSAGKKIDDSHRNERSVAQTERLEREYGLHPAKDRQRTEVQRFTPVDYTLGDLKRQVGAVVKPAVATYRFQTLGEFRALLSLYNVGCEEVVGEMNGEPRRGLLYTVLNGPGKKVGVPFKSSLFGRSAGISGLERHMARSRERIEKERMDERTRSRVAEALAGSTTEEALRKRLQTFHIELYLRRNDTGRITGVTFIDHETRCVMNGSRLGKAYSANAFNERLMIMRESSIDNTTSCSKETLPKKVLKGIITIY